MKKVFVIATTFIFLLTLSSCNKTTYEYDSFSDHFLDSFADVYAQEGTYLVYYYSETCSDCASLKQDILAYLDSYVDTEYYMICDGTSDDQFLYEDFYVTPTLFVMENNEIKEKYLSSVQILEYIE